MSAEKKNKRLAASAVALVCALGLAGLCGIGYALFAGHDTAVNKVDIAYHDTAVVEDFQPPEKLEPEIEIPKKVQVANNGTDVCYVRVFCEFADASAEDFASLDYDEAKWTRHGNWWYLNEPLGIGETSAPLITKITIGQVGTEELADFEVLVVQESVQAKGTDGANLSLEAAWATVNVDATAPAE